MSVLRTHAGIFAGVGPARPSDLAAFASSKLSLVRLRAQVNPLKDLDKWRDAGATMFILQLLSPLPAQRPLSPQDFIDHFSEHVKEFLVAGETLVEIHDEPNRADRGAALSWQDGAGFSVWFLEVARLLHQRFGAEVQIGFPALAPSGLPHPEPIAPIDEMIFLDQCADTLAAADWAALHLYWRNLEQLRAFDGTMRFLRRYLERFPEQTFAVTEFANVNRDVPARMRGHQYAEFMTVSAQYNCIVASCGFPLRSGDPRLSSLAWLGSEEGSQETLTAVAERPRSPKPSTIPLTWPTETRRYMQHFGEHQQHYYDCCGLSGGHNGVDLAVGPSRPSPIRSALKGSIVQVALDQMGYKHHVRVRSYNEEGKEITLLYALLSDIEVTAGTLVNRGDLLGWIDPEPTQEHPHLHLGMRIQGIRIPVVNHWVNPAPYLEAGRN